MWVPEMVLTMRIKGLHRTSIKLKVFTAGAPSISWYLDSAMKIKAILILN